MKFVANTSKLEKQYRETCIVSYTRRLIAFMIDNCILGVAAPLLANVLAGLHIFDCYWIGFFGLFVVVQYCTGGQTLGKWLLKIRVVDARTNKRVKFWQLLVKYLLIGLIPAVIRLLLDSEFMALINPNNWMMLVLVFGVLCCIALTACVNRERNIFWDVASYTRELALPPKRQMK